VARSRSSWPEPAAAVPVGLLIGLPALRVRGVNLAVITLAAAAAIDALVFNPSWFSGGLGGRTVPPPTIFGLNLGVAAGNSYPRVVFGVFLLVVVTLVGLSVARMRGSATGRMLIAVRSNERAAAAAGIRVAPAKLFAFALSAFIAGLGGGLLGYLQGTVSAPTFATFTSLSLLAIAYVAGIGAARRLGAKLASFIGMAEVLFATEAARAAVDEAHRHGQLVFSHSSNLEGTKVAIDAGVDVLAHTPEATSGIDEAMLRRMIAQHMTIIPTLKLFSRDDDIANIRGLDYRFHQLGGRLVYGTDTGFLPDYEQSEEFRQLMQAGFGYREVLAMLTTAPAELFHLSQREGKVMPGMRGDLTILSEDPASEHADAFTKVRYTIRGGKVIWHSN